MTRMRAIIRLIKGEGPVTDIAGLIERTEDRLPVFNGRGGLELIDNFRIGCRGMILAPDCVDYAVRAWEAFHAGNEAVAEVEYAKMPAGGGFRHAGHRELDLLRQAAVRRLHRRPDT
ncbi:hypothetical protein NKI77_16795 [Mesorhizobium opportunistum]|uniref:Uncharacterized protein n=1 Tax=Mesorhizobium opportunistum TaxID=593909 RepID=A0ABV1YH29_9HYPH|nr:MULTISPECIES: hypothetical protein [Mesorhizobium]WJI42173.1 hypothetical protein NL534_29005 [Mesorhizobium opportunistum]